MPAIALTALVLCTGMAHQVVMSAPLLCIGSALWDVIGRSSAGPAAGSDTPGRITRAPGGVALNIAMGLAGHGLRVDLLSAVGRDPEGDEILSEALKRGVGTDHVHRAGAAPTDHYMAMEGADGLLSAIADTRSLDLAEEAILRPLVDGRIGAGTGAFTGTAILDGNLAPALLKRIATGPCLACADLRVVAASPAKALRLSPFLHLARATIYLNLAEAVQLLGQFVCDAAAAARALSGPGGARILVTNGAREAALAGPHGLTVARPEPGPVRRVTGAGDALVAAHVAAELRGLDAAHALEAGLAAAARHIAGDAAA